MAACVVLLSACGGGADAVVVRDIHVGFAHAPRDLVEASSAAMSRTQPGVLYTINDSGNEPLLYALDTTGASRGVWRVTGATNVDWEGTTVAPCAPAVTHQCVYIGHTGDNMFDRDRYTIYRVPEPVVGDSTLRDSVRAERLDFTYGGAHRNVEAMWVVSNGDIYLIAKLLPKFLPWMGSDAAIYRLPVAVWSAHGTATAEFTGVTLHMTMISDAALSPDARHIMVRTPKLAMVFATLASGMIDLTVRPVFCRLSGLDQRQGEGVSWIDNAGRFVFTSEGRAAPLNLGSCPLPSR